MGIHVFRDDAGERRVYPPFVANQSGYDIIVWNDMDDRAAARTEHYARERAVELWDATHGQGTTRYERRVVLDQTKWSDDTRAIIRVKFDTAPIEALPWDAPTSSPAVPA